MPCVIYLHGNSSSRLEALEAVPYLLPSNITLFCFDFGGCGMSEGEYISLGWYEREDLALIIEYLRKYKRVSTIGLWGRSMGAVTSLLYGDRDPSIAGMVLDSPFCDMKQLVHELAKSYTKIPSFLISGALKLVRSTVKSKAKFDMLDLAPINHVANCYIPALFAVANSDDFIQPHHAQKLFDSYAGDKNIVRFEGDHNSPRPKFFLDSVTIFFYNTLQCENLLTEATKRKKQPINVF
jgi:cephalosporin-C deacetylase-like acetyl esterase